MPIYIPFQVARLQKSVVQALTQEARGRDDVQEAIARLDSDLVDITMVDKYYCNFTSDLLSCVDQGCAFVKILGGRTG